MHNTRVYCFSCRSTNTYLSGEGYNTVQVCKDCGSEEHRPWEKGDRNDVWNPCKEGEEYD